MIAIIIFLFFTLPHTIIQSRVNFILIFALSLSLSFFFDNKRIHTAINNEVKIAWMCIKCIITAALGDDVNMCDKKMHYGALLYSKCTHEKKFTSSPVIMLAMHFFSSKTSSSFAFSLSLYLPFQLCIDFYPRHCDECALYVRVCMYVQSFESEREREREQTLATLH